MIFLLFQKFGTGYPEQGKLRWTSLVHFTENPNWCHCKNLGKPMPGKP